MEATNTDEGGEFPDQLLNDGVFYDHQSERFCRIDVDKDAGEVIFLDDGNETEFARESIAEFDPDGVFRLPDEAVEDPAEYLQNVIDTMVEGQIPEERAHIDYVKQHTVIEPDE